MAPKTPLIQIRPYQAYVEDDCFSSSSYFDPPDKLQGTLESDSELDSGNEEVDDESIKTHHPLFRPLPCLPTPSDSDGDIEEGDDDVNCKYKKDYDHKVTENAESEDDWKDRVLNPDACTDEELAMRHGQQNDATASFPSRRQEHSAETYEKDEERKPRPLPPIPSCSTGSRPSLLPQSPPHPIIDLECPIGTQFDYQCVSDLQLDGTSASVVHEHDVCDRDRDRNSMAIDLSHQRNHDSNIDGHVHHHHQTALAAALQTSNATREFQHNHLSSSSASSRHDSYNLLLVSSSSFSSSSSSSSSHKTKHPSQQPLPPRIMGPRAPPFPSSFPFSSLDPYRLSRAVEPRKTKTEVRLESEGRQLEAKGEGGGGMRKYGYARERGVVYDDRRVGLGARKGMWGVLKRAWREWEWEGW